MTGPVLFQCGTLTTYCEELGAVYGSTLVQIHPSDVKKLGLAKGDKVNLISAGGKATAEVLPTNHVQEGTAFAPNHFVEAGINNLFGQGEGGAMVFVKIEKA
jgi:anaerobic selenocysteine-containing dehydrogenase